MSDRLAILALLATLYGCGGSSGTHIDSNERVVHTETLAHEPLSYRFGPVPESWERIEIPDNDVAWHDRNTDGVIHVDHSCAAGQDVPLPSLVQHLLIGFTEREMVTEETIPFDEREARHVVVRARLDGVPTMLELFVLKKDGCVYDIGYVALPSRFEQGRGGFGSFAHGFGTVQSPGRSGSGGAR